MSDYVSLDAALSTGFAVLGVALLAAPFAFPLAFTSGWVIVAFGGGLVSLALAAQFASDGVMRGDAVRYQG